MKREEKRERKLVNLSNAFIFLLLYTAYSWLSFNSIRTVWYCWSISLSHEF